MKNRKNLCNVAKKRNRRRVPWLQAKIVEKRKRDTIYRCEIIIISMYGRKILKAARKQVCK
jgi:hypothetical protein